MRPIRLTLAALLMFALVSLPAMDWSLAPKPFTKLVPVSTGFLGPGWASASDFGANFRDTLAFVTDGTNEIYVDISGGFAYPVSANGLNHGWTVHSGSEAAADRDAGTDRRLAGLIQEIETGGPGTFKVELGATGDWDIYMACGDFSFDPSACQVVIKDDTTTKATISGDPGAGSFLDASGAIRTAAQWIADSTNGGTKITVTFATTTANFVLGNGTTRANLAHLRLVQVAVATTPRGMLMGVGP